MAALGRLSTLGLDTVGRAVRMPPVPVLPSGRTVDLPGRGPTYVVDTGPLTAPDGTPAPTVFLMHALACSGLLTWYPSLDALRKRYRLVIFDQRWHAQGIRSPRFDLDDCADDIVAVADALSIDRFVAAGYSMGSLVSQLAWRRHPDRVAGLVLAASTTHFAATPRRSRPVAAAGARLGRAAVTERLAIAETIDEDMDSRWAWRQFRSTTGREVAAAGSVIAGFDSRPWVDQVNVPVAVVVTGRDRLLPPARQRDLARRTGATVYEIAAGHSACVLSADLFRPAMLAATASVTGRARALR
ncbi:MAG: alpha/beta hydrolase [Jatrophihabitans sp.]